MEKTPEFLKFRTAAQLGYLVDKLSSDLCFETSNLTCITSDSEPSDITKHDASCMAVIALCGSLESVIAELKSSFV